jgi:magnesium transporter
MINTLAVTTSFKLKQNLTLDELNSQEIAWYWVDFTCPTEEEILLLKTHFKFHHLAIEDCLHLLQRPKLDYYEGYNFFVLHSLNQNTLKAEELDLFVGDNFVVSFHLNESIEIKEAREKLIASENLWQEGSTYIAYIIFDKLVDHYFPAVYNIEDYITDLDENENNKSIKHLMDKLFETRSELLKLRRIVVQMRDLMYRIQSSDHLVDFKKKHVYFSDVYDHLLRLTEMLESSQAITSEMRENYTSINSNRMNNIMMLLTVVTSIFIPLTFIVGVYGMNFKYMPELEWRYSYFLVMGLMSALAIILFYLFKKKGWFDINK